MALQTVQPSGGTPTSQDFLQLQTRWASLLNPVLRAFGLGVSIPVGSILQWGGNVAPPNYLLCSGQTLLQNAYPQLFLAIGTNFNTGGEAAGSFRLPAAGSPLPIIIKVDS